MKKFTDSYYFQKCKILTSFKKQFDMKCCCAQLVARLEPEFTCYLRGRLYPGPSHAMLADLSLSKITGLRKLILTILYLILLASPSMAFPRNKRGEPETTVIEHNDKIIVQTTGCRSLTPQELRARMGSAFDESKMAYDDASMKRSSLQQTVIKDGDGNDNIDDLGFLFDDSDIDDISDKRNKDHTVSVQNRKFMRKKRDLTNNEIDSDSLQNTGFLYQNLAYDTITKRKSRQKRSSSSHIFRPAWECKKLKGWRKMEEGYFPTRILDGTCGKPKPETCFFGMYTCNPVKYSIKVLKRDPEDACRPVPLIGTNTTYEETWTFVRQTVTVSCECGLASSADVSDNDSEKLDKVSDKKEGSKKKKSRNRSKGKGR